MSDRELLELAAKAAGMIQDAPGWRHEDLTVLASDGGWRRWNPLQDDGDALRLAAKMELDVMHRVVSGRRIEVLAAGGPLMKHFYEGDTAAAMRRAIVMCAAEVGKRKTGVTNVGASA